MAVPRYVSPVERLREIPPREDRESPTPMLVSYLVISGEEGEPTVAYPREKLRARRFVANLPSW